MKPSEPLLILCISAALICFASGLWGAQRHFVRRPRVPGGMRIVTLLSFAAWAWFGIRLARFGLGPGAVLGITAMAAAAALFWYAVAATRSRPPSIAFSQTRPSVLHDGGPYRFIRHPFYVSYMLCWVGTSLITPGLLSWVVPAFFAAIYIRLAVREEFTFKRSDLSESYRNYQRKVGMFFPKLDLRTLVEKFAQDQQVAPIQLAATDEPATRQHD